MPKIGSKKGRKNLNWDDRKQDVPFLWTARALSCCIFETQSQTLEGRSPEGATRELLLLTEFQRAFPLVTFNMYEVACSYEQLLAYTEKLHEDRGVDLTNFPHRLADRGRTLNTKSYVRERERTEPFLTEVMRVYRATLAAVPEPEPLERSAADRSFPRDMLHVSFDRQKGFCPYCGRKLKPVGEQASDPTVADHMVPWSKGGLTVQENCAAVHQSCNLEKSDMTATEYIMLLEKRRAESRCNLP